MDLVSLRCLLSVYSRSVSAMVFDWLPCCVDREAQRREEEASEKAAKMLKECGKSGDAAEKVYDNWSSYYDDTLKHWKYPCPAESAKFLKELAGGDKGSIAVLDAGCGTGMTGEAMNAAGFKNITGIDISDASLEQSKTKGVYAALRKADMDKALDFADDAFEVVMCVGTISYVQEVAELLKEFLRVCKPGGVVLWTNRADWWKEDKRTVKTASEQMEKDGLWKQVLMSEEMDYLPNNPIKEDRELKVYYVAYRKSDSQDGSVI